MRRKLLRPAALVLAVVLVLSAALLVIRRWDKSQGWFPQQEMDATSDTVVHDGKEYVLKKDVDTVLVMGLDAFGASSESDSYNNQKQADFIMLFVIDKAASSYTALHIDRDTIAEMNVLGVAGEKIGTVEKQIALSHNYGNGKEVSCRNVSDAVSTLLHGADIDHYVSLTMDAVPLYTDLVGGVALTVLDDFTGVDDTLVKGETVTLDGEQALTYIRSRQGLSDSTNQNRMARQRQFARALMEQTRTCLQNDTNFAAESLLKLTKYLVSDCSSTRLQSLFETLQSYTFEGIVGLSGEKKIEDGYAAFYPKEEALTHTVLDLFYTEKE